MAPLVIFVLWFGYISQQGGGLLLTVDDYYLSTRLLGGNTEVFIFNCVRVREKVEVVSSVYITDQTVFKQ
jgi:hypothetical protein